MLNYSDRKVLLEKEKEDSLKNKYSNNKNIKSRGVNKSQSTPKSKIMQIDESQEKINSEEFFKLSKYHEPFTKQGKILVI
jgi:hypothetical protein